MIVVTVSVCTPSLRGDLTKWLFEIAPGVYVGDVSARVRDRLWERIGKNIGSGRACMVYGVRSETHFAFKTIGETWEPTDFDGITLMKHPLKSNTAQKADSKKWEESCKTGSQKKAGRSIQSSLPGNYVVLDLETTGLDPLKDQIIEIALIKVVDDAVTEEFRRFIQVRGEVSPFIEQLTGITNNRLKAEGIGLKQALEESLNFIRSNPLVCHNADFDLGFLREACVKEGVPFPNCRVFDTLKLARQKITGIKNYRLNTLIDCLGLMPHPSHEGLADCLAVHSLLCELKKIGCGKQEKAFT